MHVISKSTAPRYQRPEGITSYLLAAPRTTEARHLTTTLVHLEPGGEQRIHSHAPEQVYFVLEGTGAMTVGADVKNVGPGDCIFVPSGAPHGLKNLGPGTLRYFSAAAPAFDASELAAIWPLASESEERRAMTEIGRT